MWRVLLTASLGVFLMPVDNSSLFIAVPKIAAGLKAAPDLIMWVPTASLVGITAFSIPLGRLSDLWGRKRLYLAGLAAAGLSALAAGSAQNAFVLIGCRLLTGAGAGLIAANAWALIAEAFPAAERGRAYGINTFFGFLGLSFGPLIGGFVITQTGTWRAPFFLLAPCYLILAAASYKWLPETPAAAVRRTNDLAGALSFIGALALLMLGLSLGRASGWRSGATLAFLGASGALLALFVYLELQVAKDPMLDLRTFARNSRFTLGNIASLFHYMSAHQAVTVLISFYVQWVLAQSAAVAGIVALAKFVTMALFSPFSGWLSDRIGPRWLCALGMAFISTSLVLLAKMGAEIGVAGVFVRLALMGVGIGLFASPNINSVLNSLPQKEAGTASGTLNTFKSLGSTLGMVLTGSILAGQASAADLAGRLQAAFLALSIVALLGTAASAARGRAVPDKAAAV